MKYKIPPIVSQITEVLIRAGFDAYLVGGCVRDLLLNNKPKDWDIATNAKPEQTQGLFERTVYENKFGTVAVITNSKDPILKVIEITPYRLESKYSDKRHPDFVSFTNNIEDDLKRRDFTINAMAIDMKAKTHEIIDLFEGQKDLKNKIIRTVGNSGDRFNEDALRILRAVRFASELGFTINQETMQALKKQAHLLEMIAKERINDEFSKILMSDNSDKALEVMHETGILKHIIPELEKGIGIKQNKDHKYEVWEHGIKAFMHAVKNNYSLEVRTASLFHDIGKPHARRWSKEKNDWTFYGHDVIGAKMAVKILSRLKYSKKFTELVAKLVRYHMFFSDTDKITLSAVRRTVRNVGKDNVWDLMRVRFADRIGMGRPKETPYRLRKYESMIEEAMRAPLSVSMLKIDGNKIMEILKIPPGPKIG
ncbi:MAG: CCA tRNA nucleotidyltransferase, partial [Patescibacteria group bacterium]